MKSRAHVIVSGLVQGVFFRAAVRERAASVGVTGYVMNRHDGKVEAVFEGDAYKVTQLVVFCREGPPSAKVKNTDVSMEEYKGEFATFEIRR